MKKSKILLSYVLVFTILISMLSITSAAGSNDFAVENGVLTKYNGSGGDVVIPDNLGIITIGTRAFENVSTLTSVTIPNGATKIGQTAFLACRNMKSVLLPASVNTIGNQAFYNCNKLSSINITGSVSSIGSGAFSNTILPNPILINQNTTLCYVPTTYTSFEIPQSVKTIGGGAFSFCNRIKSITIQNGVTSIGDNAFASCTSLTTVSIPNSVTYIGSWAFGWCAALKYISIPDSVTTIGGGAFLGSGITTPIYISSGKILCYVPASSTKFALPPNVALIMMDAFYGCSGITSLIIPKGVASIGDYAFFNCINLESITIPKNVRSIGYQAFSGCSNLTIFCYAGSYAQQYALTNEIKYSLIVEKLDAPVITLNPYEIKKSGSAVVSWNAVDNAVSYFVSIYSGSTLLSCNESKTTSYTISGLSEGSYIIKAFANGNTICGPESNSKLLIVKKESAYKWYAQKAETPEGGWETGDPTNMANIDIRSNVAKYMSTDGCLLTSSAMILSNLGANTKELDSDIRNNGTMTYLEPDPFNMCYINYSLNKDITKFAGVELSGEKLTLYQYAYTNPATINAFGYKLMSDDLPGDSQAKLNKIATLFQEHLEGVIINSNNSHFYVVVGVQYGTDGQTVSDLLAFDTFGGKGVAAGTNLQGVTLSSLRSAHPSLSYYNVESFKNVRYFTPY